MGKKSKKNKGAAAVAAGVANTGRDDPLSSIQQSVPNPPLNLYQARDWPHRLNDPIGNLELHAFPLPTSSPGRRSVPCEQCSSPALCVHDNVLCWKCKGSFCFHCTSEHVGGPNGVVGLGLERVLNPGWGECPRCHEPFRALALPAVFRPILEATGPKSMTSDQSFQPTGVRLLTREAEDALRRGEDLSKESASQAMNEFTHSINAVNYLASITLGNGLVLRARDILIIAHAKRARLEGDKELFRALGGAFPKQSVRVSTAAGSARSDASNGRAETKGVSKKEKEWHVSDSGFSSLFYPLPASWMAGGGPEGGGGGLVCADMRSSSRDEAFASPFYAEQMRLAGGDIHLARMTKESSPQLDGPDSEFDSLGGTFKAVMVYDWRGQRRKLSMTKTGAGAATIHNTDYILSAIQFIFMFPSALASSEYLRVRVETKTFGEEGPPLNSKHDQSLAKSLRGRTADLGAKGVGKVYVLVGVSALIQGSNRAIGVSVLVSVCNACTKIFLSSIIDGGERHKNRFTDAAISVAARAIFYMSERIHAVRSPSASELVKVQSYRADLTVCAFCGSGEGAEERAELARCGRCGVGYCSSDCQKAHWNMKGEFGHKKTCKEWSKWVPEVETNPKVAVMPVTDMDDFSEAFQDFSTSEVDDGFGDADIPRLGEVVRIDRLQSEAGQRMNGRQAFVLSRPNDSGRVQLVIIDDLTPDEVRRIESGEISWVPDRQKKLIKISCLSGLR